jgi:hypothetical protein
LPSDGREAVGGCIGGMTVVRQAGLGFEDRRVLPSSIWRPSDDQLKA